MVDHLAKTKGIKIVDGRVFTVARFGNKVAHADIYESKDIKGLRADAFVLCSSQFLITQLNELRTVFPIIRAPTELV